MSEFYLKILSGNHLGAEIPLEPGQYTLGRGDDSDLVLSDASLADIELTITISEDGLLAISSQEQNNNLYLNGNPAPSSIQINHFDIITSSNLFFSLGPADADWPDQPLPELQRPEPEPEDELPEGEQPSGDEIDSGEFPDDLGFPDDLEASDNETPALTLPDNATDNAKEIDDDDSEDEDFENPLAGIDKRWLIGVPVGVLIVLLSIIILSLSGSSDEPDIADFLQQAKNIRAELRQKNVKLRELPDKSILVSGYIMTISDKQNLQRVLQERGIPFTSQLVIMNELRANADAILNNRGYKSLSLELDNSPGSLVMTGYVSSSEELNKIVSMLKQEVHGLVSIVDQVENQTGRVNTLKSMLREKGLAPRIHLIQKPNQITLEGHLLDDEQVYNLNNIVNRFRKRYGNRPELKLATKHAGSPGKVAGPLSPSLSITGVSMGRVPFVVMEDGAKYLIGAKLANGYVIEEINLEYLLLTKGTNRIKYRLGGSRGGTQSKQ
ncbi:EscD/YscD/HrpQ family type III secretion system inner membrane ring protein [Endozoicomonas sp. OPT23]|uniref:type III secretion system inner membrane ring subunit SctD n=1 Tax=Endozoicomonas sp. OPT23 TaxID=2072845 RepID=UPI00129B03C6|nr:type III secretion system inner membrane ring subunit SctD [Endozoicomonas sp. OPT23]MRI35052.1 EscD/YscD/HrpQ family type III secretion system inner membrane ring protein [Endozoicomonas sp. OPT23]